MRADWIKWFNVDLCGTQPPRGLYRVCACDEKLQITLRGLDRRLYTVKLRDGGPLKLYWFPEVGEFVSLTCLVWYTDFGKEAQERLGHWGVKATEQKNEMPILMIPTVRQILEFLAQEDCA